jgi:hypothetical protein
LLNSRRLADGVIYADHPAADRNFPINRAHKLGDAGPGCIRDCHIKAVKITGIGGIAKNTLKDGIVIAHLCDQFEFHMQPRFNLTPQSDDSTYAL